MSLIDRAVKSVGLRQRSYQSLFAEGSPAHHVLTELAIYSKAFAADGEGLGATHDQIMIMHGRRQMFFMIVNHLKLSTDELEAFYVSLASRGARPHLMPMPGADE